MSKRRGGVPQAAAGAQWRQQQELAALAAALQEMPAADAPPLLLLRELQRVLLCVEHTLNGAPPPPAEAAEAADSADADELGDGIPAAAAAAAAVALESEMTCREVLAADRAAVLLSEVLTAVAADGGDGEWGGGQYAMALLHHCLALSSDLLDQCSRGRTTAASATSSKAAEPEAGAAASVEDGGGGSGEWMVRRDELASAARRRLPVAVYLRVVTAMGWEEQLVDMLTWIPNRAISPAIVQQALRLWPRLAPGLAAALAAATGSGGGGGAAAAAVGAHSAAAWRPARVWRLARDRGVLLGLAEAVRQAAAEAADGAGGDPTAGRQWLPCLLLLGRALEDAIRLPDTGPASVAAGSACLAACCEALQEGLCAWQAAIVRPMPEVTTASLLQLTQGPLLALLDEQGRLNLAAAQPQDHQQQQQQQRSPLLPYTSVIRLRSRIALLGLEVAAAAAAAPPAAPSLGPAITGAVAGPGAGSRPAAPEPSAAPSGPQATTEDDVWCSRPAVSPARGFGGAVAWTADGSRRGAAAAVAASGHEQAAQRPLPVWLRAATGPYAAAAAPVQRLRRFRSPYALLLQPRTAAVAGTVAGGPAASASGLTAAAERVAAAAVALLTPGLASWLVVQRDEHVAAAAGPDPYSPFRVALALLEMTQGGFGASSGRRDPAAGAGAGAGAAQAREEEREGEERQLELVVLQMAVECMMCVGAVEQQAALQAVVRAAPQFRSLRARLAGDAALHAAAGRALVTLSNRAAAVEGSLERLALSAQQEAQRLAAAARDLLPYAVLVPTACIRRLVLDGLTHAGQQPWVLQLMRCFAVAAAAPEPAVQAAGAAAAAAAPVVIVCLRDVLRNAPQLLRTAADRRSLLGLLAGLLGAGVLAARQVLEALVVPALAREGSQSVLQIQCALLVAQQVLGGSGSEPQLRFCPAKELAAARPARLLLAAATTLESLYDLYDTRRQLEAAAIDAAAAVLERGVELYGRHLAAAAAAGRRLGGDELAEAEVLVAGCEGLPRRILGALLPVLELATAAVSGQADAGVGGSDDGAAEGETGGDGGARSRAITSKLAPAATWRPRSLRGADPRFAHGVLYDTLTFAASSSAHAAALRRALMDAAADAADAAEGSGSDDGGPGAPGTQPHPSGSWWVSWGDEVLCAASQGGAAGGVGAGAIARHVAATAARGLPQLPQARLLEGAATALAALLPTWTSEQARRVLLAVLPPLLRVAGGGVALVPELVALEVGQRLAPEAWGGAAPVAAAGHEIGSEAGSQAPRVGVLQEALMLMVAEAQSRLGPGLDTQHRPATAFPAVADVAGAIALSCAAAARALQEAAKAAAEEEGRRAASGGGGDGDEEGGPALSALLSSTADRCGAHLALLAARLATLTSAALSNPRQQQQQQQKLAARHGGSGGGFDGSIAREVDVVYMVLLAGLCGVAAVAAELAAPGDRALDVWQAVLLSSLQHLISALAAGCSSAPAASAEDQANGLCTAATATATAANPVGSTDTDWLHCVLRYVLRALCALPSPADDVLCDALERLCEDEDQRAEGALGRRQSDEGCGPLAAAVRSAMEAQLGALPQGPGG